MKTFKLFSVLLLYPDNELISHCSELKNFVHSSKLGFVEPLIDYMQNSEDLIELQKDYTFIFDLTPACSLYILEHFADDKNKGKNLLEFLEKYTQKGLNIAQNTTPDYLPIYLEYLSLIEKDKALAEIDSYSDVFDKIYKKLKGLNSPYALVFQALAKKEVLSELP
ncbi:Respiratory nitrate reductase delta chain [Desulfurella amilsii]|uniref:Respiratory nitrate reductase delta chain n=1 Tax=Desulfurella amilsii TaxID=1562698 RepID=A0A1X4XW70_9BACT|nr:nitrate reductase molybdenum cofactor assembly chaperone [Desulfurella amilsii]OSS41781.1 Respiratory nitrate reductase delta chain [Desulfurella amilsii]